MKKIQETIELLQCVDAGSCAYSYIPNIKEFQDFYNDMDAKIYWMIYGLQELKSILNKGGGNYERTKESNKSKSKGIK